jgi:hypothetical protein
MRRLRWFPIVLVLALITVTISAHALPQLANKRVARSGYLTDEEIEELSASWINEVTGAKFQMFVRLGVPKLTEAAKEKAIKKEQVPYRLTVSLYRYEKGQTKGKLFKSPLFFYILDSEGETAVKKITKSSMVMCPS